MSAERPSCERKPLHRPLASHLHFPSLVPVSLSKRHDAQRISYPHPRHSRDDAHAVPDLRPARPLRARPPETKVFPSSQRALRPLVTLPSAPDPRARAIDRPPMFPTRVQPRALRSRPSLVPVRRSHERGWMVCPRARPCSHAAATSAGAGGRRPRNGGGMRVVDGRLSVRETREASRADAFYCCTFSMTHVRAIPRAKLPSRATPFVPRPLFVHSSCKPWVEVGMEAPRTSSSRASRSARRIAAAVARNGPATSHLRADS